MVNRRDANAAPSTHHPHRNPLVASGHAPYPRPVPHLAPMHPSSNTSDLPAQLRSLDLGLRLFMTFVFLGLAFNAIRCMFGIPELERLFVHMLGSKDKLAVLTALLIASYPGCLLLPILLVFIFLPSVWIPRNPAVACFMGGVGSLVLLVTARATAGGCPVYIRAVSKIFPIPISSARVTALGLISGTSRITGPPIGADCARSSRSR